MEEPPAKGQQLLATFRNVWNGHKKNWCYGVRQHVWKDATDMTMAHGVLRSSNDGV